ncbi:hydroxymyristoyl-ACP dehydratase [Caldanaerobius polysaccharolyticus]|uniref:hydroxymyristoyl-ACP dehydratase n=1 Tax=Caldanaerobius polysaccharolyticus TaxID=44256 RepID=UPI0012EC2580|nr:hydroxymyristoyl-ACP dehydratase [Caldanaerobius polysaccharolyticus]
MMNINCTEKCIYQEDGKCTLNHIEPINSTYNPTNCAYFVEKKKKSAESATQKGENSP